MTLKSPKGRVLLDWSNVSLYVIIGICILIWLFLLAPVSYFHTTDITEYLKEAVPECTRDGDHHPLAITGISLGINLLWLVTISFLVKQILSYVAKYSRDQFPEQAVNINDIQLVTWLLIILFIIIGFPIIFLLTSLLFLGICVWDSFSSPRVQLLSKQSMCLGAVLLIVSFGSLPRWLAIMELSDKLQAYCQNQVL